MDIIDSLGTTICVRHIEHAVLTHRDRWRIEVAYASGRVVVYAYDEETPAREFFRNLSANMVALNNRDTGMQNATN